MATLQELLDQRTQLQQQIAGVEQQISALQSEERQEAIAKIKALLAQYGLTVADLAGSAAPRAEKAAKAPKTAGSKVAPKYRDPATGSTWTGRGLKPRWLTAAIEAGGKVEDFAI